MLRYGRWGRKKMPISPCTGRSRVPAHVGHSWATILAIDVFPTPLKVSEVASEPREVDDSLGSRYEGVLSFLHTEIKRPQKLFTPSFGSSCPSSRRNNRYAFE